MNILTSRSFSRLDVAKYIYGERDRGEGAVYE